MPADFRALSSVRQLAKVTFATEEVIENFLARPDDHLTGVTIPRHGSARAPREAWKVSSPDAKTFLGALRLEFDGFLRQWFSDRYPQAGLHGYVAGRSALTNARPHVGRRALVKADVQEFFRSIRTATVYAALLRLGLTPGGSQLIARVVTHDGALPLGYPTSPLFSNIVLFEVDHQLGALAQTYQATYTRYADDLTFSGDNNLPAPAEVADVLRGVGLVLHPTKTKERKRGQALYVTGYSVTDTSPHAPRPMKRRLRQELYYVGKHGFSDHLKRVPHASATAEFDRIVGQIEHVRHVEPAVGADMLARWDARPKEHDGQRARASRATPTPVVLLFDDSSFPFCGTEFRALGTVLLRDYAVVAARLRDVIAEFLLDNIMPEHARDLVRAKGLHFNDLPPDFRRDAVAVAAGAPVRAHVIFDAASDSKKTQMAKFLRSALKWRLGDCHGRLVTLVFEEGEYIKKNEADALVQAAFDALPEQSRPLRIEDVRVVGKLDDPCVALPDIYLGAWQQFACGRQPNRVVNRDRDERLFRSLQPKIGTIFRPSTGALFTSRNPFDGLAPP